MPVTPVSINFFAFSGSPARCKYANRVKSFLRNLYSSGTGSFTFTIISDEAYKASAVSTNFAPALIYWLSRYPMLAPAFDWILTSCPDSTIVLTELGVKPTRFSLFFTSDGTPIIIICKM